MYDDLVEFLQESVTPFHAAATAESWLCAAGFTRLEEADYWNLEPGKGYYTTRNGSSVVAWRVPQHAIGGWRIVASHSDSPSWKIKADTVENDGCRRLSVEMQKALEARMNRTGMKFMPQVFENGWYCACGAFHPKEEDTVYCSECGSDRILLQNALNTLLQPEAPVRQPEPQPAAQPVRPAAPAEEPTRIVGAAQEEATRIIPPRAAEPAPGYAPAAEMDATRVVTRAPEQEATRVLSRQPEPVRPAKSFAPDEEVEKYGTRVVPSTPAAAPSRLQAKPLDEEDDCEEEDPRDSIAETLIRWVPPITAIVCAGIALCGFVYSQFMM